MADSGLLSNKVDVLSETIAERTTYVHTIYSHLLEQPGIRMEWKGEVRSHQMEKNKLLVSESTAYYSHTYHSTNMSIRQ